jgi:hypothetical protein
MKKNLITASTACFVLILLVMNQCSNYSMDSHGRTGPRVVSISPVNGSDSVDLITKIQVRFDRPMDTISCMENFYLHRGYYQGHDGEVQHGHFEWDRDHRNMIFSPSDSLEPDMDYTVHMGSGMMGHDGHTMMHGSNHMENDVFYHFRTK